MRPTRKQVEAWYSSNRTGLGIVQGEVSGCLETMEFDDNATYMDFRANAEAAGLGELVRRIEEGYSEKSPSEGVHWPYYCSEIQGNTKLARRPSMGPVGPTGPNKKATNGPFSLGSPRWICAWSTPSMSSTLSLKLS